MKAETRPPEQLAPRPNIGASVSFLSAGAPASTVATIANNDFSLSTVVGITQISATGSAEVNASVPVLARRMYPHVFDEDAPTGKISIFIRSALSSSRSALDAYGEPNLSGVASYLAQVATSMRSAYPLTEFNENLGAVVAFIRRAVLANQASDLSRPALNALISALQSVESNPLIDLNDATDLIDRLSSVGWQGEYGDANRLISLLLDEGTTDDEEPQRDFFVAQPNAVDST